MRTTRGLVHQPRLSTFPGDTTTKPHRADRPGTLLKPGFLKPSQLQPAHNRGLRQMTPSMQATCLRRPQTRRARRQMSHALAIAFEYYLALPSNTNTPSPRHGASARCLGSVTLSARTRYSTLPTRRSDSRQTPCTHVETGRNERLHTPNTLGRRSREAGSRS